VPVRGALIALLEGEQICGFRIWHKHSVGVALHYTYTGLMAYHFKLDRVSRMTYAVNGATLPDQNRVHGVQISTAMNSVDRYTTGVSQGAQIMDLKKKKPTGPRAVLFLIHKFP
jgi:hypothetical protein